MKFYITILGLAVIALTSCKKLLDPEPENIKSLEQMFNEPTFAQGFLINAYSLMPAYYDNTEYATDDAVTNQIGSAYQQMATGAWTVNNNPVSLWNPCYDGIQSINLFLENSAKVKFAADPEAGRLFNVRMRGEAFGLRAYFYYYLLRNHAGIVNGQVTGVPLILNYQTPTSDYNQPRASFDACIKQIYKDLDSAEVYLPTEFNNIGSAAQIPDRFKVYTQIADTYNRVMGEASRQLFNGLIAKAVRAKVALLAASPAFKGSTNPATWADAATYAAALIDFRGGPNALPVDGGTFYVTGVDGVNGGVNPAEIIWRANVSASENSNQQEIQNYPPSLFGSGMMNPTQNLVDAFPMANGFPIGDIRGNYSIANPYAGRDPRFAKYIIYDGSTAGVNNAVIRTGSTSTTQDGIGVASTSTRTGYYMKKRLRMDVNRNPNSINNRNHYIPRIRFTELYLSYAEAANEAYGPTAPAPGRSYSAYDIIKAIRKRALSPNAAFTDTYLEECKADQGKMQELIRNERRLELSFEGFRFWDLRRWNVPLSKLNETARGLNVNGTTYTPIDNVEIRSYQNYMYYGPIPGTEVRKFSSLLQNQNWK